MTYLKNGNMGEYVAFDYFYERKPFWLGRILNLLNILINDFDVKNKAEALELLKTSYAALNSIKMRKFKKITNNLVNEKELFDLVEEILI